VHPRRAAPRPRLGLPLSAQLANQLEVSDHAPTGTTPQMTFAVTAA
jgi:hypothetical protein